MKSRLANPMKIAGLSLLLLLVAGLARSETKVLEGYLIDSKCASYYLDSQPDKLPDHSRACVLACGRAGGYGLIANSQYHAFDSDGAGLAQEWLEKANQDKDLRARVTFTGEKEKPKILKIE
jgi:hypothetical protein